MEDKIENYIEGDKIDVEKMISNYRNYIYSIVARNSYGLLNEADIEDAVSDVFLNIWRNKEKLREVDSLNSYIGIISKNVTYDLLRKNKKFQNEIELTEELNICFDDGIDVSVDENELKEVICEELDGIDGIDYKIFSKYYYSCKTIKEISEELDMKESTVKVKLHRMRKKLKVSLEKRGINFAYAILLALIIFVFGVIYSDEIIAFIKNMFINSSKGVDTAIDNGYIQEDINKSSISKGIEVSVDSILMDDYNLCILFKINSKDVDLSNLKEIEIPNLIITDENNNLIVTKNKEPSDLNSYVSENNDKLHHDISNGSEDWKIVNEFENGITLSYNTHSDKFPNSKKLNIILDTINLIYKDDSINKINGNWNIKVNLSEEYTNRDDILYTMINSNENVTLEYAKVSNTGCSVKLDLRCKEEDVKNINGKVIEEIYIENERGEKFYPAKMADSDGGISKLINNNNIEIEEMFNYTSYDVTDKIWIHIVKNEVFFTNNDEIIIELRRK